MPTESFNNTLELLIKLIMQNKYKFVKLRLQLLSELIKGFS